MPYYFTLNNFSNSTCICVTSRTTFGGYAFKDFSNCKVFAIPFLAPLLKMELVLVLLTVELSKKREFRNCCAWRALFQDPF